jgi:hypothetical protein
VFAGFNERNVCFFLLQEHLTCKMHGEVRNTYTILAREFKGNRTFIKYRHRCGDNIKAVVCIDVVRIHVAEERVLWWAVLNMVVNIWVA